MSNATKTKVYNTPHLYTNQSGSGNIILNSIDTVYFAENIFYSYRKTHYWRKQQPSTSYMAPYMLMQI
jgi:hypothetical protein